MNYLVISIAELVLQLCNLGVNCFVIIVVNIVAIIRVPHITIKYVLIDIDILMHKYNEVSSLPFFKQILFIQQ